MFERASRFRFVLAAAALLAAGAAFANSTAQAPPLAQDWTNAGLITADDNWTAVPAIEGFRGDTLTATTAVDPQTVVAGDDAAPVIDVLANQTDVTILTGGVAEFDALANPGVALQGSGTADAPYLRLYLNTTGFTNVNVAYNLRDVDSSGDNAVQPFALQYRVGNTGNFTNLPAGFVADASTGPNLATAVTPVSVTLPAAAEGQALVQVRIITTNAIGNDEWVAVDDINVTGTPAGGMAGALQFSSATYSIGEAGVQATIGVTRTGGSTGAVTVNYATSNGTATAGSDYTAASGTLSFANGQTSASFNVPLLDDTLDEPDETVNLTLSMPGGGATLGSPGTAVLTLTDDDVAGTLQFSAATYSVGETGGTATITVTRATGSSGTVTVNYATSNGTATAGSDYTAASGTLTFVNGDTSETFSVPILPDALVEGDETVNLALSNPGGGATLGSPTTAVLTIIDVPPSANLGITKSDSPDPVVATGTITYTIVVSNAGPDAAQNVTVTDNVPANTTIGTVTAMGGTVGGGAGVVTVTYPSLANGASATITMTVTVNPGVAPGTIISNTASVASTTGDPNMMNNSATATTTVTGAPNVTGTKTASGGNRVPGGSVTYTVVLTNNGNGTQLDNPGDEFVDVLPSSLVLQTATATSGTAVATVGTNTVTWNGTIAAGGSVTITINASIPAGTPAFTSISNQGTVFTDLDANGTNETQRPTDDPGAAGAANATAFVVQQAFAIIPTLGEWGRIALMLALAGLALLALRRRTAVG